MIDKIKKVSGKLTWSLIGNIVYALSQWIIITIIARYGNASDLGVYNIGLAVTAPIFLFFEFQLRLIFVTEKNNKNSFSEFFSSRIIHMFLAYLVVIPVAFLYGNNKEVIISILLMGLAKYLESLSDICYAYFQKNGQIDRIGKSQLLRGIYSTLIVSGTYLLSENIVLSIGSLTLVMFFRFIFYDLKNVKKHIEVSFFINKIYLVLIKNAYPLGFTSLVFSLNTNIPRYILDKTMGIEEVGIYSVLYYILIAANTFMVPVMLLLAPKIADAYKKKNKRGFVVLNVKLSFIITIIFLIIFSIIYPFTSQILVLLYGKEYFIYNGPLNILLISLLFGFLIQLYNITIVTMRVLKLHFIINLSVCILTFVVGMELIGSQGLIGAAYTLLISRIVHFILSVLLIYIMINKKK